MKNIPYFGRLVLALVVVMILAQFAPEPTNYILALVLVGILLSKSETFKSLFVTVSTVGKKV
jgi:hypothetical protein